jgi:hypothetical protein
VKYHNYVTELIDSLLKDQDDHHGPVAFIDFLARTGEVSKVIEALSLEVGALESFEAKAAMDNVTFFWQTVENELAQVNFSSLISKILEWIFQIDSSDSTMKEIFSQKSPEARNAMENAKKELERVRAEIEKIFGNSGDVEISPVDVSFRFE